MNLLVYTVFELFAKANCRKPQQLTQITVFFYDGLFWLNVSQSIGLYLILNDAL